MIPQMTIVYHTEYGKGYVVNNTLKGKDWLVYCRFGKHIDWAMKSDIQNGSSPISLRPDKPKLEKGVDNIEQTIKAILFGGDS